MLLEGGVDDLLSCNGKEEERGKRAGEVEIREHETAACARICISARERERYRSRNATRNSASLICDDEATLGWVLADYDSPWPYR